MDAQAINYFPHFTNTNARVEKLMISLESEMNAQDSKKIKWDEYIIDISQVLEYGVNNFLAKKLGVNINRDFLFIDRANLEWRNIIIEKCLKECAELQRR